MILVTVNSKYVNTIHSKYGKLREGQVYIVSSDWDFIKSDLFTQVGKAKKKREVTHGNSKR